MPYDRELHGPRRVVGPGFHARVHDLVRWVPRGRVTTYGDLAAALGLRGAARQVGFALAAAPDDVPWHRVVTARGLLAVRAGGAPSSRQSRRLRAEGVAVDGRGRVVDFAGRRWIPPVRRLPD
jgi:methylated-DNA-protein-cysteine methyltransferase-like protein